MSSRIVIDINTLEGNHVNSEQLLYITMVLEDSLNDWAENEDFGFAGLEFTTGVEFDVRDEEELGENDDEDRDEDDAPNPKSFDTDLFSTVFTHVAYDADRYILTLKFHSGKMWQYIDVPEIVAHELLTADSPGSYYHHRIRGAYDSLPYHP